MYIMHFCYEGASGFQAATDQSEYLCQQVRSEWIGLHQSEIVTQRLWKGDKKKDTGSNLLNTSCHIHCLQICIINLVEINENDIWPQIGGDLR